MEENKKLYSLTAITVATFFGGPLAASILIRKNCIVLGREQQGTYSLVLGVIFSIIIFCGIFLIPEPVIDKIPNALIPITYTAIICLIVEKMQGKELTAHKETNGEFFSNWRAAGVGAVCCVIIFAVLIGGLYLGEKDWDEDQYNVKIEQFDQNDALAFKLYDILDKKPKKKIIEYIETVSIPKLQENINLLGEMDAIQDIPTEYQDYNNLLREYCQVRLEMYKLIAKIVDEETEAYDAELEKLGQRLNEIMSRMNK